MCQQLRLVNKQTTDRMLPEANRWQCRVAVQTACLLKTSSSAHVSRSNKRQNETARRHGNTC
jgi:hypothetical protein